MNGQMKCNVIGIDAGGGKNPILKQAPLKYKLNQMQSEVGLNIFDIHFYYFFT
jgi:hypothetical protein